MECGSLGGRCYGGGGAASVVETRRRGEVEGIIHYK